MAQTYRLTGPQGARSRISVGSPANNISRRFGKVPAFILDLDQTIWDTSDEAKAIEDDLVFRLKKEKGFLVAKDWDEWTKAASEVRPIPEMVDFTKRLQSQGITPVIMTARDEANKRNDCKHTKKIWYQRRQYNDEGNERCSAGFVQ